MGKIKKLKGYKVHPIIIIFAALFTSFLQYYTMEMSWRSAGELFWIPTINLIIGIISIFTFDMIILVIFKRMDVAFNISSVFFVILSIANFYVNKLHGTPFTFLELKNTGTAMDVIANYNFTLEKRIIGILLLFLVEIFVVNICMNKKKIERCISLYLSVGLSMSMFFAYIPNNAVVPHDVVFWSWYDAMIEYGYTPCLIQSTIQSFNAIKEPDDYNEKDIEKFINTYQVNKNNGNTPDIIFILNETFYDLNQITDTNTGGSCFNYINGLENTITGYAISPNSGGGTNRSEYELLTSNSLQLAPNVTPFNVIDMAGANSIVNYLETKGYTTLGGHSEAAANYCRNTGYPGLGFDKVYFDGDFKDKSYYGNRMYYETDYSLYKNMIRWYEEMPEAPRFMYLLTIQNHGEYEINPEEYDIVHTQNDYGEYTDDINEFMTGIYLSDKDFQTLVDYYNTVDRDVIILMVGDHCPSFAVDIVDSKYSAEEKEYRLRKVPYVIWSNNSELIKEENPNDMSMVYMTPYVLDIAGVDLSGYYDYMLQLKEKVPVLSSYGMYIDANGKMHKYEDETEYTDDINMYFNLDYANIKKKDIINKFTR